MQQFHKLSTNAGCELGSCKLQGTGADREMYLRHIPRLVG